MQLPPGGRWAVPVGAVAIGKVHSEENRGITVTIILWRHNASDSEKQPCVSAQQQKLSL